MNNLSKRSFIILAIFIVVGIIFIVKLFRIQVLDSEYKQFATNNILREEVQYPARGLVFDRNGKLLVYNKAAFDLLITPREVKTFDTLFLCNLLEIEKNDLIDRIQKAKAYSRYKPSIIVKQIPPEVFAILQEQLYKFNGFHTQSRTLRDYSYPTAAHLLGYVSEVGPADIERDSYYRSGDYIGASGIEQAYEEELRGIKGIKKSLVDVHNRIQGSYLNGQEDVSSVIGKNVVLTIDIELQRYAEQLFVNKKGSMVAIEPSTGEILALLSAPSYDPGLLVGRVRSKNYLDLNSDTLNPLFNRALQARYPPGSTFKTVNSLIGLEERVISEYTQFTCNGPESSPISCTHYHESPLNVVSAIRESCNPFLWNTFRSILGKYDSTAEGFDVWNNYVTSFGLGNKVGKEFQNENPGLVPGVSYYNDRFNGTWWRALTIRSLSIGQGELGVTPLQMANVSAIIANRGYYYTPHVIKEVENDTIPKDFQTKKYSAISSGNFEPVIEGMAQAMQLNAVYRARIPNIEMCGKTGTVQNPLGSDHSVFMAFAPRNNPKIAIFVYVEHGVWGSRWAAPIASLIVEKYLTGTIETEYRKSIEKTVIEANLLNPIQPD